MWVRRKTMRVFTAFFIVLAAGIVVAGQEQRVEKPKFSTEYKPAEFSDPKGLRR